MAVRANAEEAALAPNHRGAISSGRPWAGLPGSLLLPGLTLQLISGFFEMKNKINTISWNYKSKLLLCDRVSRALSSVSGEVGEEEEEGSQASWSCTGPWWTPGLCPSLQEAAVPWCDGSAPSLPHQLPPPPQGGEANQLGSSKAQLKGVCVPREQPQSGSGIWASLTASRAPSFPVGLLFTACAPCFCARASLSGAWGN